MKSKLKRFTDPGTEDLIQALNSLVENNNESAARLFLCHARASLLCRVADALELEYKLSEPMIELVNKIMDSEDVD